MGNPGMSNKKPKITGRKRRELLRKCRSQRWPGNRCVSTKKQSKKRKVPKEFEDEEYLPDEEYDGGRILRNRRQLRERKRPKIHLVEEEDEEEDDDDNNNNKNHDDDDVDEEDNEKENVPIPNNVPLGEQADNTNNNNENNPTDHNENIESIVMNDFRNFTMKIYNQMLENGLWNEIIMKLEKVNGRNFKIVANYKDLKEHHKPKTILLCNALRSIMTMIQEKPEIRVRSIQGIIETHSKFYPSLSIRLIRKSLLGLFNTSLLINLSSKKRSTKNLINDKDNRKAMTDWMVWRLKIKPPPTAKDFMEFVNIYFHCEIHTRLAQLWLNQLGFRYRTTSTLEMYDDGRNRTDVKEDRAQYVANMLDLQQYTREFKGSELQEEIQPLKSPRTVVCYHDECCCHANENVRKNWRLPGQTGQMKEKNQGKICMVSGFVCAEGGMFKDSLKFIKPSSSETSDDFWNNVQFLAQFAEFLIEFDTKFPEDRCYCIFDNSSGHDAQPPDGLNIHKLNKFPGHGRAGGINIRDGWFRKETGEIQTQHFHFQTGDKLHMKIKKNKDLTQNRKSTIDHEIGEIIESGNELIGVLKGANQILCERSINYKDQRCKIDIQREEFNQIRSEVLEMYEEDKNNMDTLVLVFSLPNEDETATILENIHCECSLCILKSQEDFKTQNLHSMNM